MLDAQKMANKALEGQLTRQVFLLTYMDVFLFLGAFFLVCIPLILFIRKGAGAPVVTDSH
jgi:DHA2 family multidrug resistance protein